MKTIDEAAKNASMEYCLSSELHRSIFEAGYRTGVKEFAKLWIPIEEELPIAYETGSWDGKRSDFVLAKDKFNEWFKARTYQGFMDGFDFCNFVDDRDNLIENITHWRPIERK